MAGRADEAGRERRRIWEGQPAGRDAGSPREKSETYQVVEARQEDVEHAGAEKDDGEDRAPDRDGPVRPGPTEPEERDGEEGRGVQERLEALLGRDHARLDGTVDLHVLPVEEPNVADDAQDAPGKQREEDEARLERVKTVPSLEHDGDGFEEDCGTFSGSALGAIWKRGRATHGRRRHLRRDQSVSVPCFDWTPGSARTDERHVERDDKEHGLLEEHDERLEDRPLERARDPVVVLLLEGGVPAIVAGFLAQSLGLTYEDVGDIGLREEEHDEEAARAREEGQRPEDPVPVDAPDLHSARDDRSKRRSAQGLPLVSTANGEKEEEEGEPHPAKGMSAKTASASPRRSASHRSAMAPPETVSGAAAKQPPRKRKTMSAPMLGAAHAMTIVRRLSCLS